MALASEEQFTAQVEQVINDLAQLAENLSAEGLLLAAGHVLSGRQTIRTLYTRLQQAATPSPANPSPEARDDRRAEPPLADTVVTVEPPPPEPPP